MVLIRLRLALSVSHGSYHSDKYIRDTMHRNDRNAIYSFVLIHVSIQLMGDCNDMLYIAYVPYVHWDACSIVTYYLILMVCVPSCRQPYDVQLTAFVLIRQSF